MAALISKIRIANMALSNVGAKSTIESFTEGSAESNAAELWYDYSRLQALAAHDWSFARRRATLTVHADAPPDGVWAYRYVYPVDCVKFRKIQNPTGSPLVTFNMDSDQANAADAIPFDVEMDDDADTKSIITDLNEAVGVYTFDQERPELFTPFFVQMFAMAIASNVCFELTGKLDLQEKIVGRFLQLSRAAPAVDSNERVDKPPRDADWIRSR